MKRTKYSQLRRNPLVRFIRWISKFFTNLLKPSKRIYRSIDRRNFQTSTSIADVENQIDCSLITVGELFDRVEWQFSPAIDSDKVADSAKKSQAHDVSLN
jgi:hypothetical protein